VQANGPQTASPIADPKAHLEYVQRRIFGIKRLAAMPQVVWRLTQALADERITINILSQIIQSDQALTSKVLSLVNSAYYGFATKIATVERAAMLLGFQELQLLALGAGLSDVFDLKKAPAEFDVEGLWLHCLAVSWLSNKLAETCRYPTPGEVMISGLLHDLGKLVLVTHLGDLFQDMLELEREGVPYHEAESLLFLHHVIIGFWLGKRWDLPEIHLEAIRYHHAPSPNLPHHVTTYIVHLADRVAKQMGFGLAQASRDVSTIPYSKAIALSEHDLRQVMKLALKELPPFLDKMRGMLANEENK
jgi:HD-like signal output (HDOD) protein